MKRKYQTRILLYINTFLNTVLLLLSTWAQEGVAQLDKTSCRKQAMRMRLCTSVLLLQGDTKRGSGAKKSLFCRPLIWLLGAAWSSGCRQRCIRRPRHSAHTACSRRRLPCWSHRQACCVPGSWRVEEEATNEGQSEREERFGGYWVEPFSQHKGVFEEQACSPQQRAGFILILFLWIKMEAFFLSPFPSSPFPF